MAANGLAETFANPLGRGADPWVVRHDGAYWWCHCERAEAVVVRRAPRLVDPGPSTVVWRRPAAGPHSRDVWAPELHRLDGRWWIYVAASDGQNRNHRMIALEGSAAAAPTGPFAFKAELFTGDSAAPGRPNRWAIDGTVFEHGGIRYFAWSGWEGDADVQHLFIDRMESPWQLRGRRVRLCANDDFPWERVGDDPRQRGLHEAPQALSRDGRLFIAYSCSGAWQATYKLGLLALRPGGDPLRPDDWRKAPEPAFRSTAETFGVGHCSFARSPDGKQDWLLYHAKTKRAEGWERELFAQPFRWRPDGTPEFGAPLRRGDQQPPPGAP